MASWKVGNTWLPEVIVRDEGVLADPATLVLRVRGPSGALSTVATTHPSTGVYRGSVVLTAPGMWVAQFETTSPSQVEGSTIHVSSAPVDAVPRDITLEAFKRRLDIEGTVDDDKLVDYLAAAVAQAQASWPLGCGRLLIPDPPLIDDDPVPKIVTARMGRALVPDASTITSVTVDGTLVVPGTGYRAWVRNGYIVQLRGLGFPSPYVPVASADEQQCVITGHFGFQSIPANLADAIYVLAGRYVYEEAVLYADRIEVLEGTAVQSYYRQLPPRCKLVFQTYAVPAGAGGLA